MMRESRDPIFYVCRNNNYEVYILLRRECKVKKVYVEYHTSMM